MNFRKLTNKQQQVFEQIATNNDSGHNVEIIKSLLNKDLIKERRIYFEDGLSGFISIYYVPIPIHIEWCQWCDDKVLEQGYINNAERDLEVLGDWSKV